MLTVFYQGTETEDGEEKLVARNFAKQRHD